MTDGLLVGETSGRALAGFLPVRDRLLRQRRCRVLVRDQLRSLVGYTRKVGYERLCDVGMKWLPPALEQALVSRVPH